MISGEDAEAAQRPRLDHMTHWKNLTANVKQAPQESITQAFRPLSAIATKKIAFHALKYLSRLRFGLDVPAVEIVHVRIIASYGAVNFPPSLPFHTLRSCTLERYYRFGDGANSSFCGGMLTRS